MKEPNANKPAQPTQGYHQFGPHDAVPITDSPGLTKRELFTLMAMRELISSPRQSGNMERIAFDAVQIADLTLKQLER